ncbi:MAG: YceD family protein [Candidatus Methylomirabilales bacterium]
MFVELSQIPEEGLDLRYPPGDLALEIEGLWEPRAPVEATVRFERRGEGVMASGVFSTIVGLTCSRCSEPFALPVHDEFQVFFVRPSPLREEEVELSREELDVEFLVEDRIDILNLIRQNILLDLPVQPLCREECRGLCSKCGANLNEGLCGCQKGRIDPRVEPLRKLLEEKRSAVGVGGEETENGEAER